MREYMNNSQLLDNYTLEQIDKYSDELADQTLNDMPPNPLLTPQQRKANIKINFKKNLTQYIEKIAFSLIAIGETLDTLYQDEKEKFSIESIEQVKGLRKTLPLLGTDDASNKSPQEICCLSDEAMQLLNRCAAYLYEQKIYEKASLVYMILTLVDPQNFGAWLGFANSEFYLKNYESAMNVYRCALEVYAKDPLCHLYLSSCYQELGQREEGLECVDNALRIIQNDSSFSNLEPTVLELKARYFAGRKGGSNEFHS